MTDCYSMPIAGSYATPVACRSDRKNHALLGSALLGGAAFYGATKLDYFKDPMSSDQFEKAVRSGEASSLQGLKGKDRLKLSTLESDVAILKDTSQFSSPQLYQQYLYKEYGITGSAELAAKIKEVETAMGKDSLGNITKEADGKIAEVKKLQDISKGVDDIDRQIADLKAKNRGSLTGDETKNLRENLRDLEKRRTSSEIHLRAEMQKFGITDANIGDIKDHNGSSIYSSMEEFVTDKTTARTQSFDIHMDQTMKKFEGALEQVRLKGEGLDKMRTDLGLAKAAEANGGLITEELAKDANATVGELTGKGEKSIAKAYEAFKGTLPKGSANLKKAGIGGAIVALGLYLLNG